jgi:hypothetical protein
MEDITGRTALWAKPFSIKTDLGDVSSFKLALNLFIGVEFLVR